MFAGACGKDTLPFPVFREGVRFGSCRRHRSSLECPVGDEVHSWRKQNKEIRTQPAGAFGGSGRGSL